MLERMRLLYGFRNTRINELQYHEKQADITRHGQSGTVEKTVSELLQL